MVVNRLFIRVRKFLIFYNFRKYNTCVEAIDGPTFESGFILLDSVQHSPVEKNGGKTFYGVCLIPNFSYILSVTLCFELMEY